MTVCGQESTCRCAITISDPCAHAKITIQGEGRKHINLVSKDRNGRLLTALHSTYPFLGSSLHIFFHWIFFALEALSQSYHVQPSTAWAEVIKNQPSVGMFMLMSFLFKTFRIVKSSKRHFCLGSSRSNPSLWTFFSRLRSSEEDEFPMLSQWRPLRLTLTEGNETKKEVSVKKK
jgi:hypothetical protein